MSECHLCVHQKDVARGVYARSRWEDTPCSKCVEPVQDQSFPVDEGRLAEVPAPEYESESLLLPLEVLADFVKMLMTLRPRLRDAVCLRYLGLSFPDVGARLNISSGTAEWRVARAVAQFPVLQVLLGGKPGRLKSRNRGRKRG